MKNVVVFLIFLIASVLWVTMSWAANDSPQSVTLDGFLYQKGTTHPLLDTSAQLKVQIISPDGNCLLYEEQQAVNTSSSKGYFSIRVGSALSSTKRTVNDPGLSMEQIFQNIMPVTANSVPTKTCIGSTYSPTSGNVRYFRVSVTPSTTMVTDVLTPDIVMDSVPQAIVAQSVQGLDRSNILHTNTAGGVSLDQLNLESLFTGTAYTNLQSILSGNFLRTDSSGATLPAYATTPVGVSIGDMWYDSTTNEIKYQTNAGVQTVGASGVVSGNSITSGTISGSTAMNTTGNITTTGVVTAGTLTGTNIQGTNLRVYNGSQYAQFTAQPMSANYSLALPTADGVSGQVMATNGSGTLSWITPSSGLAGTISVGQGGTAATAFSASRIIASNVTGTALESFSCSLNQVISFDVAGNALCANANSLVGSSFISNGGNATGASISLGTKDANAIFFNTNDTFRAAITSNGRFGVGTSAPGTTIEGFMYDTTVYNPSARKYNGALFQNFTNTSVNGTFSSIGLTADASGGSASTGVGIINLIQPTNGVAASDLAIQVGSVTSINEIMRLKSSGYVGIGTSTPNNTLHVENLVLPNSNTASLVYLNNNAGSQQSTMTMNHSGAGLWLNLQRGGTLIGNLNSQNSTFNIGSGNTDLTFQTGGLSMNERMRITSAGNVGIGTNSPSGILDVQGGTAAVNVSGTNVKIFSQAGGAGNTNGGHIELTPGAGSGTGKRGSVFVGPRSTFETLGFSPADLSIVGSSSARSMIFLMPTANTTALLSAFDTGGNFVGEISQYGRVTFPNFSGTYAAGGTLTLDSTYNPAKGQILIGPAGGNVAIGHSNPSSTLDIAGAFTAQGLSSAPSVSPSRTGRIFFDYATNKFRVSENGGGYQDLLSSGSVSGAYVQGGNSFSATATLGTSDNFPLQLKANNSVAMTISQNGNVGIGTIRPDALLAVQTTGNANVINVKNSTAQNVVTMGTENLGSGVLTINSQTGSPSIELRSSGSIGPRILVNDAGNINDGGGNYYGAALGIMVPASVGQENGIIFSNSGNSVGAAITSYTADLWVYGQQGLNFKTSDNANTKTRMTITHLGDVGIGTSNPASSLDLSSKTDGINMPRGTTAQQPTCNATMEGNLRYNSQVKLMEFCNGTIWQKLPAVQTAGQTAPAGSGYFVLTNDSFQGGFGGLSGADSQCLTDLTTYNWMGKAAAQSNGQLVSNKVKAFLCDALSCNNLLPLATYYFATSGDPTAGGASFVTNSSGAGPNDTTVWSSANYFQSSATYWSNRSLGTNSLWGTSPFFNGNSGWETQCGNSGQTWNNASLNGVFGDLSQNGSGRWNVNNASCSISRRLICFVNP